MGRIGSLDALRGMAAVTVVLTHIHGVFFSHHVSLDTTPLRIFWAGGEAVILFFVLSGYVLSAPYWASRGVPFGQFIAGRVARIYVPYISVIAVCVLLSAALFDPESLRRHAFLTSLWPHPINIPLVLSHVTMTGNFNTTAYDPVIWSLVHEMRFALVFPIFLALLRLTDWKQSLALAFALSIFAAIFTFNGFDASLGFKNSLLYSAHYLMFFVAGALLAKNSSLIGARVADLSRSQRRMWGIGSLVLYTYSAALVWAVAANHHPGLTVLSEFAADWGVGVASAIFIALAVHCKPVESALRRPALLYFGKISYSLYLVHVPILASLLFVGGRLPESVIVAIAVPIILVVTAGFHQFVEAPAQQLGKRLICNRFRSAADGL